ncbi:MAG: alpha/beta fold hydrolase [Planctomycetota bacterium]
MRTVLLPLTLVLTCWPAPAFAQCKKPPVPSGGLATAAVVDQPLSYSDGYKTFVNLTYPTATPPSCGWPLVVFVHGYGGRRTVQHGIARYGFAVAAQDVRGQGSSRRINPASKGLSFYGAREKYDLAELIYFVRNRWKGLVSQTRVAVTGASQGGIHSWFAAAYSGRQITIAGRGTIIFPKIDVVAPQNFAPDTMQHAIRGDTLYSMDAMARMLSVISTATLDPVLVNKWKQSFLAQDPAGLARQLHAEPGRDVSPLLKTTSVPILFAHAYYDAIQVPREMMPVLASIPRATPVQAILSTIGHHSPLNNYEAALRSEQRLRWFDRYLWDIRNGVEREARYVLGAVPLRSVDLKNRAYSWDHRFDDGYPAKDVTARRRWLSSAGKLETSEPAPGPATVITHQVRSGYTPALFMSSPFQRTTGAILANIPLSGRGFAMAPLDAESELGGSPRVSLSVVPSASRFTLCALLTARIPGQSARVLVSSWARGVLGARANQPMRLEFDLSPASCVLPKGSILELFLRNHWLREAPMLRSIVTAPYFVSSTLKVRHGKALEASWLNLPFRRSVRVGLVGNRNTILLSRPSDLSMQVRGGTGRRGRLYVTLATMSGQAPGLLLPGGLLRLAPDPVTQLFLAIANSATAPAFVGLLPADGVARPAARFSLMASLPAPLLNQRMSFATWVFDSPQGLQGSPSNPIDLLLR